MERRKFFRDVLMTCAISLLPKVLQPQLPDVLSEDISELKFFHIPTMSKEDMELLLNGCDAWTYTVGKVKVIG